MDKADVIKTETEALLSKIVTQCEVEVQEEEGIFHVIIKAENDAPTIIGRHGETIRALQKILEVILYKQFGESVGLLVNVNDYREKQKEKLEELASQYAQRVLSTKESNTIRHLSSYERKLIHQYITQNYPDLTSYSIGEGKERQLVINLKNDEQNKQPEEKK